MSVEVELTAAIQRLVEIGEANTTDDDARAEAKRHRGELERLRARLVPKPLQTNLIGAVGAGKTSLLSSLAGLYVGERPTTVDEQAARSILPVGSGKSTASLVRVRAPSGDEAQDRLGLLVSPVSAEELRRLVQTVAEMELFSRRPADERGPDQRLEKAGEELRRVVLHMTGYGERKETYFEGNLKRLKIVRPLDEVVFALREPAALTAHLLERLNQGERLATEWWFDDTQEGRQELRALFARINLGTEPTSPLPEEITLVAPWLRAMPDEDALTLLDTRGLDEAVATRADLFSALRAPEAVTLLCSSFVDAPSPRVREVLLELGRDLTLRSARERLILVILDKGEAARVIDAEGDREQGQLSRREESWRALEAEGLTDGLSPSRVLVYDPLLDDPAVLLSLIRSCRSAHRAKLEARAQSALEASRPLREGEAAAKASRERLDLLVSGVLRQHPLLGEPLEDPLRGLKLALQGCPFAYRLHASLRWEGTFRNLHLLNAVEVEARSAATAWLRPLQEALTRRIREEVAQDGAAARLEELQEAFEATVKEYGDSVGTEVTALLQRAPVWTEALNEWGRGAGFRERVVAHFEGWGKVQSFTAHRSTSLAQHIPQLRSLQAPEDAPGFVLEVQNLRRLRRLRWALHGLNLLVGANGSGKTTVFAALRFFGRAVADDGVELAALMELKALSGLRTWGVDENEPVRVALERGLTRWEFELRPGSEGLLFRERLLHGGDEVYVVLEDRQLTFRGQGMGVVSRDSGLRHLLRLKKVDVPLQRMAELAESLRISYSTDLVGLIEQGGARPLPTRPLESRGQNAYSVLQRLKDAPGQAHKYEFVLEGLRDAFPQHVESLAFETSEHRTAVFILAPGGRPPSPISQEAEGLVQLLVNLVAVASANPGDVIALDEPDSHLHPVAAKAFIHHIERRAWEHKLTILIATHSVVLLNEMWATPERVFVMKPSPATKALPMPLTDWYSKAWFAQENNATIHLGRLAIGDLYATASLGIDDEDAWA
jgi:energy-coupling factor transporter ATP-binding protein EcfA2